MFADLEIMNKLLCASADERYMCIYVANIELHLGLPAYQSKTNSVILRLLQVIALARCDG